MKIQVLSDLHIEFENLALEDNDADVVVLAGDIHLKDKGVTWALENIKDKPVLYVLGNHEFYGKAYPKHLEAVKQKAEGTHVHVLEKTSCTIDGVNFLGCTLWTDFALFGDPRIAGSHCQEIMTDFKKIRVSPKFSKLRSIDVATIHRQSLQSLKEALMRNEGETNVVITHHGPSRASLPEALREEMSSAAYVSELDAMVKECRPDLWIHGHVHHSSNYQIGGCSVICNPRGYPQERNPEFDVNLMIAASSQG